MRGRDDESELYRVQSSTEGIPSGSVQSTEFRVRMYTVCQHCEFRLTIKRRFVREKVGLTNR